VERILEVPLADLADPAVQGVRKHEGENEPSLSPHFLVAGERVWGATAMVLAELLWVLGAPPRPGG
jgi:hypothetical protein